MDKEKVKMLQEVLGYFQEMQENNTLVGIAFKTSDGKQHEIGKTAMELEHHLNNFSFNANRFAESIPYMHRTLQQTFFRLVKASILHMARQKPTSIDGRNKASYEMCCRLAPMLQDSPLPFV